MSTSLIEISNPERIYDPRPHGYSHVASVPAWSQLVFVAGQGGSKTDGVLSPDFRTQVAIVFENIAIALASKGLKMENIAKLTTLVVDYDEAKHEILIEESNKIWPDQKFPVNTLIPVQKLALNGMLIEIDATAVG
jgi:enamine deaminase RidA (YjgF/YER057c/UK114 family)